MNFRNRMKTWETEQKAMADQKEKEKAQARPYLVPHFIHLTTPTLPYILFGIISNSDPLLYAGDLHFCRLSLTLSGSTFRRSRCFRRSSRSSTRTGSPSASCTRWDTSVNMYQVGHKCEPTHMGCLSKYEGSIQPNVWLYIWFLTNRTSCMTHDRRS